MKEKFCTADMNGSRKSDNNILPGKPANKEGKISAEQVEGRALTEGNIVVPAAVRTQGRGAVSIGLQGVLSIKNRGQTTFNFVGCNMIKNI